MTVDDRFAADRFRSRYAEGAGSVARLLHELDDAILAEMQPVVAEKLEEIVGRLNGMGHRLTIETDELGDVQYHDQEDPPEGAHCWLRVGADIVISTGWTDVADTSEPT